MQGANIMVAIGGDKGNLVPKTVSAAEIAVLRQIHGPDSIVDVEPVKGTFKGPDGESIDEKAHLQELRERYAGAHDEDRNRHIDLVFPPGPGTKLVKTLDALDLPAESFKAKSRASAADATVNVGPLPPKAAGTDHEVPPRMNARAQPGDVMLESLPPGDLFKKYNVENSPHIGEPGVTAEDFLA